jgi:hypothetical protein
MPAKDLGTKHICPKCGTRFYDLKKPDPRCPKCGADPREAPPKTSAAAEKRAAKAKKVEEEVEVPEEGDADVDEDIPEDDDDA